MLADNTAQAVRNYLKKLFQEEAKFRGRWIWELLQNARDASSPNGVHVWLTLRPDRVVFRHDGLPFTYKNIAHLIYHGTTKYEPSVAPAAMMFALREKHTPEPVLKRASS